MDQIRLETSEMYLFEFDPERNAKVAKRLFCVENNIIEIEEMIPIFRAIRFVADRDANLANAIVPYAGDYLHPFDIQSLIRADLADSDAALLIAHRKAEVDRLRHLIIPITSMFGVNEGNIVYLASEVYHTVEDFARIQRFGRSDRSLTKLIETMNICDSHIKELTLLLKELPYEIDKNFSEFRSVFHKTAYQENKSTATLAGLNHDLELLSACIELELIKQRNGISKMYIRDNSEKKFIVESAYVLSKDFCGPKFVTSPNSDFACFCGFLLELAGGRKDESFAGAIASFARSPRKAQIDADEERFRNDEKRRREPEDNFCEAKDSAERSFDEAILIKDILNLCEPGSPAYGLCTIMIDQKLNDTRRILDQYGPNPVFASRISPKDLAETGKKHHAQFERLRSLDIELGKIRRQSGAS